MIRVKFIPLNTKLRKRWMVLGLLTTFGIVVVMSEEAEGIFSSYSIAKLKEQSLKGKSIGPNRGEETRLLADAPGFQGRINELKSPNPSVRLEAVKALGFFREKRAVQFIIPLVKDPALAVREAAVEALGRINDPQGVVAIIPALKDPDKQVRRAAVEALRTIKDSRGIVALIPSLKDPFTSDAAFNALWEIADIPSIEAGVLPERLSGDGAADPPGRVFDGSLPEEAFLQPNATSFF